MKTSLCEPNLNDAPAWAKWLAQDGNGIWFWYDEKPTIMNQCNRSDTIFEEKNLVAYAGYSEPTQKALKTRQCLK